MHETETITKEDKRFTTDSERPYLDVLSKGDFSKGGSRETAGKAQIAAIKLAKEIISKPSQFTPNLIEIANRLKHKYDYSTSDSQNIWFRA